MTSRSKSWGITTTKLASPRRSASSPAPAPAIAPLKAKYDEFCIPAITARVSGPLSPTSTSVGRLRGSELMAKPNRNSWMMGSPIIIPKVMWSRLEPKAGQLWYRAGMLFTGADQVALEMFIATHLKDA